MKVRKELILLQNMACDGNMKVNHIVLQRYIRYW